MTSSESAPVGSTAPSGSGTERSAVEETDDLGVTAELPPSGHATGRSPRATKPRRPLVDKARTSETTEKTGESANGKTTKREPLFAPAQRPGRRVIRIVRHVQLWSVFKVVLLGGLVFYAIFLIATGIGWSLANTTGQVHHVEQFMRQIGFDNWSFNGPQLFRGAALLGALLLAAGSVLVTLAAAIMNLIAEATGGIRFTVIETDETDDDDSDDDDSDDDMG